MDAAFSTAEPSQSEIVSGAILLAFVGLDKGLEALLLLAVSTNVLRAQPSLISGFKCRPFIVDNRKLGGIPVAAFIDNRLPEQAFIAEAQTRCGGAGGGIQAIAFPFIAPVAKLFEDAAHQ